MSKEDASYHQQSWDLRGHFTFTIRLVCWLLLDYFCSVFLSHQMTPLHVAAEKGDSLDLVKYLVGKGADINIEDYCGVS